MTPGMLWQRIQAVSMASDSSPSGQMPLPYSFMTGLVAFRPMPRQRIHPSRFRITHYLLASPGFCRHSNSGGKSERLHSTSVLPFDDEFREAVACGGIQEKFRQAVTQRIGHHQLRGRNAGPDGAQPGAEGSPDPPREGDGQVLKQSLTDNRRLDEDMVGVQLAPDGVAVFARRTMHVLVAAAPPQRFWQPRLAELILQTTTVRSFRNELRLNI